MTTAHPQSCPRRPGTVFGMAAVASEQAMGLRRASDLPPGDAACSCLVYPAVVRHRPSILVDERSTFELLSKCVMYSQLAVESRKERRVK